MINICFHGIGVPQRLVETDEERYWISLEMYEQVLEEVAHRPDVAISFDDGNVSDIELGLPGLLRHQLTATFFVLASRLDQPGCLTTGDVQRLAAHGMSIGSHGMDHVPWRALSATDLDRELVGARRLISEAVGRPVGEAALPLGRYDRRVLTALKRSGYHRVYSSDRRAARAGDWLQPRFSIRVDDTIHSVRADVLSAPSALHLLRARAIGIFKQFR